MVEKYVRVCRDLSVPPNSGIVAELEDDEQCMSRDRINFRLNYLGNRGVQAVLCLLHVNSHLKYLNLSHQGIHNAGVHAIALTFYHHPSLANLDLSYNRISNEGGKILRTLADENEALLTLDLSHNDINFRLLAKIEGLLEKKQRGPSRLSSMQMHSQVFDTNIPTEMDETESLAPPAFTPAESSQSLLSSRAVSYVGEPHYASFPRQMTNYRF